VEVEEEALESMTAVLEEVLEGVVAEEASVSAASQTLLQKDIFHLSNTAVQSITSNLTHTLKHAN